MMPQATPSRFARYIAEVFDRAKVPPKERMGSYARFLLSRQLEELFPASISFTARAIHEKGFRQYLEALGPDEAAKGVHSLLAEAIRTLPASRKIDPRSTSNPTTAKEQVEPMIRGPGRYQAFISYSHKDEKRLIELQTMLTPHVQSNAIDVWDDTKIKAGDIWKREIEKALSLAKVAILLVSANFLASDFIKKHELPPLLQAAENGGVIILWICVSSCAYKETEIAKYQALHDIKRPLDQMTRV